MTTSSTKLQAERDEIAREYAAAPQDQRDLLALLSAQTPPPADTETPPMPADLLDRLRGQYGSEMAEPDAENIFTAPRRAVTAPGFMERVRKLFAVPAFQWGGLVTACLAVALGVVLMRPDSPVGSEGKPQDQWRGQPMPVAQSGPLFVWLGSDSTERAAVADKVPDMLDAASADAARELSLKNPEATVYVLDAAAGTVTVLANGETKATQPLRAGALPEAKAAGLLDALRKAQRSSP